MKGFLVVLMWVFLFLLYLALCSILRGIMGMNAAYGIVTVFIAYPLWRLGRAWSRRIRS